VFSNALPNSPILLNRPSRSHRSFAASSALSKLPPKPGTLSTSQTTKSSPVKQSLYSPINGNFTGRKGISVAARFRRSDTAKGGSARPANRIGGGGCAGIGDGGFISIFAGGRAGDMGGGEPTNSGNFGVSSTALPLPLSIFAEGSTSPSPFSLSSVSRDEVDEAWRCNSLNR
jgi:hypothetical protein